MRLPLPPPAFDDVVRNDVDGFVAALWLRLGPEVEGKYLHWDQLRHRSPPHGIDSRMWWVAIKQARNALRRELPLRDKFGNPCSLAVTDGMQRILHFLDREAAGAIEGLDPGHDGEGRRHYLLRSLIEEAMTSAQLEGAVTTREVAKDMLRSGRRPRDKSEQMIYNNFLAMQALQRQRVQALTPAAVLELHRTLTRDTLDDPDTAGRLRRGDEHVPVFDHRDGSVLHELPAAETLPARLQALCDFANAGDATGTFLHPVLRAIVLHYQLAYDHPFVDGNGRTARALFYWSMLRQGYWLTEYLSISSVLRKAPAQYARAFLYCETDDADLGYFVEHQLRVIEKAVEGLRAYMLRKSRERRESENLLRPTSALGARLNHRQRELLLDAIRQPESVYRIAQHRGRHGVTYQTARSDLLGLEAAGLLLHEKRGKAFVFRPVADLAERLEKG